MQIDAARPAAQAPMRALLAALGIDPATPITWQTFPDSPAARQVGGRALTRCWAAPLAEAWPDLAALSARDAGCYWTISATEGGRRRENYRGARAAWCDIDRPEMPASLAPPPTATVRTGRGWHLYWALAEGETVAAGDLARQCRAIAEALGGDVRATDPTRVLRVPGLPHLGTGAPVPVELAAADASRRYSLAELAAAWPPTSAPERAPTARQDGAGGAVAAGAVETSRYGSAALDRELARVAGAPEGARNDALNRAALAVGQLIAGGELPAAALDRLAGAGLAAGLGAAEVAATVRSGATAGAREPRRRPPRAAAPDARQRLTRGGAALRLAARGGVALEAAATAEARQEREEPAGPEMPRHYSEHGPGRPIACAETAIALLLGDPALEAADGSGSIVRWDAFAGRAVLRGPWTGGAWGAPPIAAGSELTDAALRSIASSWAARYGVRLSDQHLRAAAATLVHSPRHTVDPLRAWALERAKAWDGRERLDGAAATYWGAREPAAAVAVRLWFLQTAARALRHRAKADCVLVLAGAQGGGKSRSVAAVCPVADWLLVGLPPLQDGEVASRALQGHWIVEVDELDAFRRADITRIKGWLTRDKDTIRWPYDRHSVTLPRRQGFVATVNPDAGGWLHDRTGNRRWMVATVGRIDIDALVRDRDQLWAEACAAVVAGASWWPVEGDAALLAEAAAEHESHDTWDGIVAEWLARPEMTDDARQRGVALRDVLCGPLGLEVGRITRGDEMRVASSMVAAGWKRRQVRLHGTRTWLYRPQMPPT